MAELTKEQLEQAYIAYDNCQKSYQRINPYERLKAAAPYLQLPWAPPTQYEILKFYAGPNTANLLMQFVEYRNADIAPKPVDPRRERIIAVLRHCVWPYEHQGEVADRILAALEEK
jgi:hypothetical protein